jgi:tRNA(Ile)-lysidine synthase
VPARARELRRAALRAQAEAQGAAFVVLGHTATDQIETMLLHACRGTGLRGLAAMGACEPWAPARELASTPEKLASATERLGFWLRPLLHLARADTRALAVELAVPFVDDPTNLDCAHPRVAIREEVLPVLRRINPEIEAHFGALAKLARDAEQAIARASDELLADISDEVDALDVDALRRVPKPVRVHALRTYCVRRGVPPDALHERTLASIEAAVAGAAAEPGRMRRWDLHPHRTLCLQAGRLRLVAAPAQEPAAPTVALGPSPPPNQSDLEPQRDDDGAPDPKRSRPNH